MDITGSRLDAAVFCALVFAKFPFNSAKIKNIRLKLTKGHKP